ncbi:DUF4352 domain-containing protein [Lachnospiraceae bacterium]|nr:DUF4352 domain-containing protein [Lachnospiraceae bacterium]
MRKIIKKGIALAAAAVLLTGCGEAVTPLTESEEATIIQYSAGTLAKHNSFQQEGLTALYPEEEAEEETEQKETEEAKEPDKEESKKEQEQKPEDKKEEKKQEGQPENTGQSTFTEALAVPGIEFSYKDYSIVSSYSQGDYFSLEASAGKVYMLLNINITNTSDAAVECNLLSKKPKFILKLNKDAGVSNQITILTNDVSTYSGTLESGQTEAGILLFEVPETAVENISSMQLTLEMEGKTTEIKMK